MASLDELLAGLAEYVGTDKAKAREVAVELKTRDVTKPIAEVLLRQGMTKRTADAENQVESLEAKVKELQGELDEKTQEIDRARSEAPDWKKRLEDTERRAKEKQDALRAELDAERTGRREDKLAIYRQKFLAELGPDVNVDADYATDTLVPKYADRFRLTEDGKLEVLEPDETTPYDATAGDPIKALAQDVLRSVKPKFRIMGQANPGGGVTGGASGDVKPRTDDEVRAMQRAKVGYATP